MSSSTKCFAFTIVFLKMYLPWLVHTGDILYTFYCAAENIEIQLTHRDGLLVEIGQFNIVQDNNKICMFCTSNFHAPKIVSEILKAIDNLQFDPTSSPEIIFIEEKGYYNVFLYHDAFFADLFYGWPFHPKSSSFDERSIISFTNMNLLEDLFMDVRQFLNEGIDIQ